MSVTPHIVSDVMTSPVVAVRRDTRFKDIVQTLVDRNVSAVPVVEADGRVAGVVSEADLLPKAEFREGDLTRAEQLQRLPDLAKAQAVTAEEVMSAPAVVVRQDVTLAQAARIMAVEHVKRLPVVDDEGRLRAIVSRGDLLKVFLRPDEDIEEEVRRTVVAYLFPALSHTIRVSAHHGVVTLRGDVHDPSLAWVAERLVRAVEGVVGVETRLSGEDTVPDGTRHE
ncbi:CBS domain-containing protein [Streptomyces sp. NPDC002265]|uniref:CBS domain-containing protein n=1 Tax=Streptomyces sp. NPDC002265 TaxID=3154415 RepID=UPI003318178D